jgi:hypothetical protein
MLHACIAIFEISLRAPRSLMNFSIRPSAGLTRTKNQTADANGCKEEVDPLKLVWFSRDYLTAHPDSPLACPSAHALRISK